MSARRSLEFVHHSSDDAVTSDGTGARRRRRRAADALEALGIVLLILIHIWFVSPRILLFLGIAHGLIASALYVTVPDWISLHFFIGPRALRYMALVSAARR